MNRLIIFLSLCCLFSFTGKAQGIVDFSDTIFQVGQIHHLRDTRYAMCGTHQMLVDSLNIAQIDSLVRFMEQNENIVIEIGVHTDSRGADSANLKISQWRSEEAKSYLVERGVPVSRIRAKGYGETQPIVSEEEINRYKKTNKRMYKLLHQQNRRTEIKIVGI